MSLRSFLANDSGAVTVDWVVLTAATVGLGLAAVANLSSGTDALASRLASALSEASIGGASSGTFVFTWYSEAQQANFFAGFRTRTDGQLVNNSNGFSNHFLNAVQAENFALAQTFVERRHINQVVLDERGLSPHANALSVSEMQQMLADAQGG